MERHLRISERRSSGVGCVRAVRNPRQPELATAEISSARPTHIMPPWTRGVRMLRVLVSQVLKGMVVVLGWSWVGVRGRVGSSEGSQAGFDLEARKSTGMVYLGNSFIDNERPCSQVRRTIAVWKSSSVDKKVVRGLDF